MQEVKKVGIWSVAKISLLFGVLFGILYGLYAAFILPSIVAANPELAAQFGTMQSGSGLMIFFIVLIYMAVVSFIVGIISALLYNLFAKLVGGVKIELKTK